ncbi:hypothetical protein ACFW6K_08275 [Streptomyces sp. NPDC058733]|uniref:hypothetical protein n=1 Tax=Streptomyces sp. NPDC058733 TaxID=3346614 RepID=UPI0036A06321
MTAGPDRFQQHLRQAAAGVLARFPAADVPEIYALSFRIWRLDDDRHPYVAIGYNTESQYARERRAEDPGEARWNYACWLLDGFEMLGNVPEDPAGSALFVERAKELGLWCDDGPDDPALPEAARDEQDDTSGAEQDGTSEGLWEYFADACTGLARHLHASGLIEEILGRPLPIVVFDMDCPGWEVEATEAANPPGLITGFLDWQRAQGA